MSKTIDERVVEMRFDNKQFEAGVKDTMSTLDKFKEKLNFNGATKGLENIESASKKVTMSGLSSAVEQIQHKFSVLEVMGVTAIANLTNEAVNYGKRLMAAFTIDPVKTGFDEYELKMGSVQTIMASTGESLATVNKYLDELNTYSDKTIYSFSDMTTNIGKFTNAGVKLEDAVMAIKGVSNEAAVSGANANEASRAMYNFAQALSAGYVKLIDWKSIENANMATVEFKNYLLEAAAACGTVEKQADGMYKILTTNANGSQFDQMVDATHNFNDSLSYQWMTTEALVSTLKDYADETTVIGKKAYASAQDVKTFSMMMDTLKEAAQSGWARTWELTLGDFEQAKALWTDAANYFGGLIDASADARNNLLETALSSKWDTFIKQINDAGIETDVFTEKLKETARQHNIAIDGLIEKEGSLAAVFQKGKLSVSIIVETLKKLATAESTVTQTTEKATAKLDDFQKVVNQVIKGDFKNGEERVKALTEAGYDNVAVQKLVNKVWERNGKTWSDTTITSEDLADAIQDMSTAEIESIGYTEEQAKKLKELADQAEKTGTPLNELINSLNKPSGREALIDSLRVSIQSLVRAISAVKGAWDDYFSIQPSDIAAIIDAIYDLTHFLEITDEDADKLRRTFKGLFAMLDIVTTFVGGGVKIAFKLLCKVLGMMNYDVLDLTASIGDNLVAFHDWLLSNNRVVKGLTKLVSWLKTGISKLQEWYGEFRNLPIVQSNLEKLNDVSTSTLSDLNEHLGASKERLDAFIERLKDMDSITVDDVKAILKDFFTNVVGYFFDVSGKFDNLRDTISQFRNDIKQHFKEIGEETDTLKGKLFNFIDSVKDKFSEHIGLGEILTIGIGASLILLLKKLSKIFKPLLDIAGGIEQIILNFGNVLLQFAGVLKSFSLKIKAKALLKIAESILVLAVAVAVLAKIPEEDLWRSVGALAALTGCMVALSAALLILNKIGFLDTGIAKNITKYSVLFIAIAGSLLGMVVAIRVLDDISPAEVVQSMTALARLAGGLLAFTLALSMIAMIPSKQLTSCTKSLLSVSASLMILVGAVAILGNMPDDVLSKGTGYLLGLTTVLTIIMALSNVLGKKASSGAKGLFTICTSLVLLATAVKIFGSMDTDTLEQGGRAVLIFLAIMGAITVATKLAGANALKAGAGILGISASLILLSGAIKILGSMDVGTLLKGAFIVGVLSVFMTALIECSMSAGPNAAKAGIMLLTMAGAIMILTVCIALFDHISLPAIAKGLFAIGALSGMFAALIAVTEKAKSCEKTLIILASTIAILTISLAALSMIDTKQLLGAMVALGGVMGMTALIIGISHFATNAIGGLVIIEIMIITLAVVLWRLSVLPIDNVTGVADALSKLILSLSVSLLLLAAVGTLGPAALIGTVSLAALIGELTGIIVAFAALNSWIPDLETFLNKGISVLGLIGDGLGTFLGGIVNGFLSESSKALPNIGTNLSQFMENAKPFIDGAKDVDSEVTDGIKNLAKAFLVLTGASILDGIAKFLGLGNASFVDFGKQLAEFAPYMKQYSDGLQGLDAEVVTASATAAKSLSELANNLPNSGGWIGTIFGENDIDAFGEKLIPFGRALNRYSIAVKGIDSDAVTNSATAAKSLSELANNLPNSGGWIGTIFGENDIDAFGEKLVPFGRYLRIYSLSVAGIDNDVISNSVTAAKSVSELANNLPNTGGLVSWFAGDNDIATFGESLCAFGRAFVSYSVMMGGVKTDTLTKTTEAAASIVSLQESLPKTGGLFSDSQTLADLGSDLGTFGAYMQEFSDRCLEINVTKMSYVLTQLQKIADFGASIKQDTPDNMKNFGQAMKSMADKGIDDFLLAFTNSYEKVSQKVPIIATYTTDSIKFAFTTKYYEYYNIGVAVIVQLCNGMQNQNAMLLSVCNTLVNGALNVMRAHYSDFYSAGSYLVSGFVNGINDNIQSAANKAATMARAASEAANQALDIHSPSRVTYQTGKYFGLGLINAITDYTSDVYDAGHDMAISAKAGLGDVLSKVSEVFDMDVDSQPTIRPVLDLTNVEAGVGRIDAIFSRQQAVAAGASFEQSRNPEPTVAGKGSSMNTYNFTQNNYSPKALSREEIYRQTNNQLSRAKKGLGIV